MSKAPPTVSIARTTPAQKLRGAHRSTRSFGFGASGGTAAWAVMEAPESARTRSTWAGVPAVSSTTTRDPAAHTAVDRGPAPAYIWVTFLSSPMTRGFAPGRAERQGDFAEGDCHGPCTADAEGNGRLAGREHHADVRPDCRLLQTASARSEGDRRWRRRPGHQRSRSGAHRAAVARRHRPGGARPRAAPQARRPQGAPAGTEVEEGPALHAGVAPAGSAERHPVAAAQPSGTQGRADHAARRHHQVDHPGDPRPYPLECAQPAADGPGDARAVLA